MMKNQLKTYAAPLATVYLAALAVLVLARIGLACMDGMGVLSYNYWSATAPYNASGPLLDQICWALTGGTLIGFMFAAGLAFGMTVAAVLVFVKVSREANAAGSSLAAPALVWGLATALVAFICLFAVVLGTFSPIQLAQMSSKGGGATGAVLVLMFVELATLLAAASCVLFACTKPDRAPGRIAVRVACAALACGVLVLVLMVGTFAAINTVEINAGAAAGWLAAGIVANLAMMYVGIKRA